MLRPRVSDFQAPPWDEPLDLEAVIAAIPAEATITGMFTARIVREAERAGSPLRGARERYVPFQKYPLREHARLLVEALPVFCPGMSPRRGLCKLGRGGYKAFVESTIGKVTIAGVSGPDTLVEGMTKAYAISMNPGRAEVTERGDNYVVVHMADIHYFLDSHHVGTFEGVLREAGLSSGQVLLRPHSLSTADFRLQW